MSTDSSLSRNPLDRLAEEFVARQRGGERPSVDEYVRRHPELADEIRDLFPALVMMERLKPAAHDDTGLHLPAPPTTGDAEGGAERLGDFRILREVGRGGMGVVYEAVQESLGRHVALKVLPAHARLDPIQKDRFRLEARLAARLHHTHIVPVHGFGEHDGVHYYAMQFIPGCGLDSVIRDLRRLRDGDPPPAPAGDPGPTTLTEASRSRAAAELLLTGLIEADSMGESPAAAPANTPAAPDSSALTNRSEPGYFRSVARIGQQVAEALAHAHAQGVLHRDIKPSNLMLEPDGHVWVTDFGLAKAEGGDGLTRTGDIVGTLRYMAPERFDGWSDPRSDVYGLGMTLYELLTLRPAHDGPSRARLVDQVLHEPVAPPRKLDSTVPRDLETIVLKAVAKEPASRYASAGALAEDLENYLAGRPIRARRVGAFETLWRWCRRNPAAAGLVATSVLAAMALVGVVVVYGFVGELRQKNEQIRTVNGRLKESLVTVRAFDYLNRIMSAKRELDDHNPDRAERLIADCAPEDRGWEWNHLKRRCHAEVLAVPGRDGPIVAHVFSPDGMRIYSAARKSIRTLDAATGRTLATWADYQLDVYGLAVSPDGRTVATAGGAPNEPGPVLLRDAQTGEVRRRFDGLAGGHAGVAFSRDGRYLGVASGARSPGPCFVRVYEVATGELLWEATTGGDLTDLPMFSPDGLSILATVGEKSIFNSSANPDRIMVWDWKAGRQRLVIRVPRVIFMNAVYSPDGSVIATASYDGIVRFWDAGTGRLARELKGHTNCINMLAFSPDGRRLATACDDNTVRGWDAASGDPLFELSGHRGGIFSVAFSPDGGKVATGGYDGVLKVWEARPDQVVRSFTTAERLDAAFDIVFNPDGDLLVSGHGDRAVRVWDVATGGLKRTLRGHQLSVYGVAVSPDGRWIASAGGDWSHPERPGEVRLWDARTGDLKHAWQAHRGVAWSVAFSPDGSLLASSGGEEQEREDGVLLWDVAAGRQLRQLDCLEGGSHCVAFSPDGRYIGAGSGNTVRVWNRETGELAATLPGFSSTTSRVAFSPPDGKRLVAAPNWSVELREWDLSTGKVTREWPGDAVGTFGLAYSPDGRRVVSVGSDMMLRVWDAHSTQEFVSIRASDVFVRAVTFSPDGRFLATCDSDGVVKLWDGSPVGGPAIPATGAGR